jgi:hypothetical protein
MGPELLCTVCLDRGELGQQSRLEGQSSSRVPDTAAPTA